MDLRAHVCTHTPPEKQNKQQKNPKEQATDTVHLEPLAHLKSCPFQQSSTGMSGCRCSCGVASVSRPIGASSGTEHQEEGRAGVVDTASCPQESPVELCPGNLNPTNQHVSQSGQAAATGHRCLYSRWPAGLCLTRGTCGRGSAIPSLLFFPAHGHIPRARFCRQHSTQTGSESQTQLERGCVLPTRSPLCLRPSCFCLCIAQHFVNNE